VNANREYEFIIIIKSDYYSYVEIIEVWSKFNIVKIIFNKKIIKYSYKKFLLASFDRALSDFPMQQPQLELLGQVRQIGDSVV